MEPGRDMQGSSLELIETHLRPSYNTIHRDIDESRLGPSRDQLELEQDQLRSRWDSTKTL